MLAINLKFIKSSPFFPNLQIIENHLFSKSQGDFVSFDQKIDYKVFFQGNRSANTPTKTKRVNQSQFELIKVY